MVFEVNTKLMIRVLNMNVLLFLLFDDLLANMSMVGMLYTIYLSNEPTWATQ